MKGIIVAVLLAVVGTSKMFVLLLPKVMFSNICEQSQSMLNQQ